MGHQEMLGRIWERLYVELGPSPVASRHPLPEGEGMLDEIPAFFVQSPPRLMRGILTALGAESGLWRYLVQFSPPHGYRSGCQRENRRSSRSVRNVRIIPEAATITTPTNAPSVRKDCPLNRI